MYFKTFGNKKSSLGKFETIKKVSRKKIHQEIRKLELFFRFANRILIFAVFFRFLRCRSVPGCKMNQSGHSMWRGLASNPIWTCLKWPIESQTNLRGNTETCYLPVVNHLSRSWSMSLFCKKVLRSQYNSSDFIKTLFDLILWNMNRFQVTFLSWIFWNSNCLEE